MVRRAAVGHDGDMNETQDHPGEDRTTQADDPQRDDFDAGRLRTIADMRRSRDDRVLAGVCSGAAKYLNVDPVVIRVIIAVLTFVGLSGLILYGAAWMFLPSEDADHNVEPSVAADWFNLDKNEEQVRIIGLVVAAVLAALAIVGDSQWAWWGLPWVLAPLAILYWVFVVRPRRKTPDDPAAPGNGDPVTADTEDTAVLPAAGDTRPGPARKVKRERKPGSSALTGLTLSVAAIAVAIAVLVGEANDGVEWTTYVAVALAVVAAGLLVGTFFGRPGPLIPIGLVLTAALAVGSLMPSGGMGEKIVNPQTAAAVDGQYKHGLGQIKFDLTDVDDIDQLLGSTIRLENGAGDIKVTVPDDLNVAIDAQVDGGEIRAFGRKSSGTDASLIHPPDDPGQPALTLHIRETFGGIEVIEQ